MKSSLILICWFLLSFPIFAQEQAEIDDDNAANASDTASFVDKIVAQAQKSGVKVVIIDATADANTAGSTNSGAAGEDASMLMKTQSDALAFRRILKNKAQALPASFDELTQALKIQSPTGELFEYIKVLYWSAILLLIGAVVEYQIYIKRIIGRWLAARVSDEPVGYTEKLPLLLGRALLKVIGIAVSMLVAYIIGSVLFPATPPEAIQFTIAIIYLAYAASRVIALIWRVILAPHLTQYRIPHFTDSAALKLYRWLVAVMTINITLFLLSVWITHLGSNSNIDAFLASVFGFVIALSNTLMVISNRHAIAGAIRGGFTESAASAPVKLVAKIWLPVSIAYFVFSWLEMTYRLVLEEPLTAPLIAGAYAILVAVIVVYGLVNYLIERFFQNRSRGKLFIAGPENDSEGTDGNGDSIEVMQSIATDVRQQHPLNTFEDLARRVAGILALLVGFSALTTIWNIDNMALYSALIDTSLDVVVILFIGYIVYHLVRIWIDDKIREESADMPELAPGDEGGATSASRLATLLPLFRNFMLVVVAVSVIFSALLELGINVSPLFAGAGVVGLAIGFGAQTLVRDIFSGAFYLFDDAFRRGEYVDIGTVKGTVENISVRSFQLRHHLGPLHTIPFGEIQHLTNYSRDWVMMKLPLRLTYDTDPERVRKLIKKLGLQLMEDPQIGDTFLQPLKSQGVIEMQDSAMIVRVKFMAKPGDQWVIRKRVFQEIRDLFQREGINFAHREVTVRLAGEQAHTLNDEQKKSVAAAALGPEDDLDNAQDSGDDR